MNHSEKKLLWLELAIARRETRSVWADLLLLGARLYAGLTIASAGLDKLPTPDWMVDQVMQMRLFPDPAFFAFVACFTEFVGGVLLALGLLTPVASVFLAFTLGAAAFGFQKVLPITGMHIAQHFFWIFLVFLAVGPGRFSVDHFLRGLLAPRSGGQPRLGIVWAVMGVLVLAPTAYGLYREFLNRTGVVVEAPSGEIQLVSPVGSFNDWDLMETPMTRGEDRTWSATIRLPEAGPIEFKFAANQSWDFSLGEVEQESAGFPIAGVGKPDAANIRAYIPKPGGYYFSVDQDTYAYELKALE